MAGETITILLQFAGITVTAFSANRKNRVFMGKIHIKTTIVTSYLGNICLLTFFELYCIIFNISAYAILL